MKGGEGAREVNPQPADLGVGVTGGEQVGSDHEGQLGIGGVAGVDHAVAFAFWRRSRLAATRWQ